MVGILQVGQKILAGFLRGRDFGHPDNGFHSLDLTEKRSIGAEFVFAPVLQQPGCFRRHFPVVGIWNAAPLIHVDAEVIDDRRWIILLLLR
ncbi:MAG: hypothetical protein BWX55_01552 [Deltaproteobacteria bacterium ADurb.Bin022]|nr:MAG: hypothetical protein BWX55_01552 [Deltaproteobacteria bacterium ADurb.Bin022]